MRIIALCIGTVSAQSGYLGSETRQQVEVNADGNTELYHEIEDDIDRAFLDTDTPDGGETLQKIPLANARFAMTNNPDDGPEWSYNWNGNGPDHVPDVAIDSNTRNKWAMSLGSGMKKYLVEVGDTPWAYAPRNITFSRFKRRDRPMTYEVWINPFFDVDQEKEITGKLCGTVAWNVSNPVNIEIDSKNDCYGEQLVAGSTIELRAVKEAKRSWHIQIKNLRVFGHPQAEAGPGEEFEPGVLSTRAAQVEAKDTSAKSKKEKQFYSRCYKKWIAKSLTCPKDERMVGESGVCTKCSHCDQCKKTC